MKQIKPCKCGAFAGWYEKRITQRQQFYDQNGEAWNSEALNERGGKRKYCAECSRDITGKIA